jgi:hypothetical protein
LQKKYEWPVTLRAYFETATVAVLSDFTESSPTSALPDAFEQLEPVSRPADEPGFS